MKIETLQSQTDSTTSDFAEFSRVTKISPALKDPNRVNIFINDQFFCSLDISQLSDLKLKIGQQLSPAELEKLKKASDFGKLYTRALEYVLLRLRSGQEIRDYLQRKTQPRLARVKDHKTNKYQTVTRDGYDPTLITPVFDRLQARGYIDDEKFARAWVENRFVGKGISRRRLEQELFKKGIAKTTIEQVLADTSRNDHSELIKIIAKKRHKYDDQKLIQYLVRQGFDYESAKTAVHETDLQNSA